MSILDFIIRFLGINKTDDYQDTKPINDNSTEQPVINNDYSESVLRLSSSLFDASEETHNNYSGSSCNVCEANKGGFNMFTCSYCDMRFCDDHRLPEKYNCQNISALSPEARMGTTPISYKK